MLWLKTFSQLSIGILIILSGGFAGVYYLVKYDDGQALKEQIQNIGNQKNAVQKKIDSLDKDLKQLQHMNVVIEEMGDEINKFLQFIPSRLTSSMIMNHLNTNAKEAGVDLQNIINHKFTEQHDFYEKIKISVTVKGFFTQILIFLSKLTGLTEVITVENFTLEEVRTGGKYVGSLNEVRMRMDIYGYRYTSPIIDKDKDKDQGEEVEK